MNHKMLATTLATLLAGSGAALAQDAPPPPGPGGMLMRADANHDGVITREEMMADVDRRFAQADTNHDGTITAEERDAAREAMMARRGGDGAGRGWGGRGGDAPMTLDAEHARAARRFDMIDANHDGKIDQAEQDAIRDRMRARRGGDDMPPPPPADAPPAPNGN